MKLSVKNKFYLLLIAFFISLTSIAQPGVEGISVDVKSDFDTKIKDAVKQSDLPAILDTVKPLKEKVIAIQPHVIETNFKTQAIQPAKMVNEPLSKLYYGLLKLGFGTYTTPYAELWINNLRSKEHVYGFHYNHLSSYYTSEKRGLAAFSDDDVNLYAKKFFKKHVLTGDANYYRNVSHFYGYPDSLIQKNDTITKLTKQCFTIFEGKINLKSFYTDSNKINYDTHLNYYTISDKFGSSENNILADALLNLFVNKEKLNVYIASDYYNTKSKKDTLSDFILRVNPYFEAGGEKWHVDLGLNAAADKFSDTTTKFYFAPKLNVHYNVYRYFVIPYAGLTGGLEKNSFRNLSATNPFIVSAPSYVNTFNTYTAFGGLRGVLSSKTSYDAKVSYGNYKNMAFFLIDYDNFLSNKFKVVYNEVNLLQVNGQVKYQLQEKINVIAKGTYYKYSLDSNAYAWHKPDFDITLSGIYNLKSKFIVKADLFYIAKQWTQQRILTNNVAELKPIQLKGIADINLSAEYRYSKMMSFFINFNNIGNIRYYRWDRYPTQRFSVMAGLTFVPF